MTAPSPRRKRGQLRLDEVWLVADTPQGSSMVPGISLVADGDGLTVVGPNPDAEHVLRWPTTTSFTCQRQAQLSDGRPATMLEIGRVDGRVLRFLLPVARVAPAETVVLEAQLETLAAQNGAMLVPKAPVTPAAPAAPAAPALSMTPPPAPGPVAAAPAPVVAAAAPLAQVGQAPPAPPGFVPAPVAGDPSLAAPPVAAPPGVGAAPVAVPAAAYPATALNTSPPGYAGTGVPVAPYAPPPNPAAYGGGPGTEGPGAVPAAASFAVGRGGSSHGDGRGDGQEKERSTTERRLSFTVVALAVVVLLALAVDVFLVIYVAHSRNATPKAAPAATAHHPGLAAPARVRTG